MYEAKIGDFVSVEMRYAIQESYTDELGRFNVRTVAHDVRRVSDVVLRVDDNAILCKNVSLVPKSDVYAGSDEDRQKVLAEQSRVDAMLNAGNRLMAALVEPEFV